MKYFANSARTNLHLWAINIKSYIIKAVAESEANGLSYGFYGIKAELVHAEWAERRL